MDKASVLRQLVSMKKLLAGYGVIQLGLFGSTVREENSPKSDIDILIDFDKSHETYLNFMAVCRILDEGFSPSKVDVVTKKGLSPYIGKIIMREVEYV